MLDTDYMDPKQLQWVEQRAEELDATDWKIFYFHHPLYSDRRARTAQKSTCGRCSSRCSSSTA